jgi:nucleotide-binding universal stress UspA family protein
MFEDVVIGIDGRQGGRDAIALARHLASPDAAITLAHVSGGRSMAGRAAALAMPLEAEASEELLAREQRDAGLDAETVLVYESSAGRGLHELAEQRGADLLVVGSCHRGPLGRAVLGDDTSGALNGAPCPVAIAPMGYAATPHRRSKLGIGYDGSPETEQALAVARELAPRSKATVKALSVVSLQSIPHGEPIPDNWPDVVKELMDDELRRLRRVQGIEGDVTYGEPSEELAAFSDGLGLLIVGSRGYGPIGRLFNGSTSNYLARRARCPLLVLPRGTGGMGASGLTIERWRNPVATNS